MRVPENSFLSKIATNSFHKNQNSQLQYMAQAQKDKKENVESRIQQQEEKHMAFFVRSEEAIENLNNMLIEAEDMINYLIENNITDGSAFGAAIDKLGSAIEVMTKIENLSEEELEEYLSTVEKLKTMLDGSGYNNTIDSELNKTPANKGPDYPSKQLDTKI